MRKRREVRKRTEVVRRENRSEEGVWTRRKEVKKENR